MKAPNLRSLATWLVTHRWPLSLFVVALLVRLHWNLTIHPLEDYYYSDMRGYLRRADAMLADPWARVEYDAFYPWGMHVLCFVVQWIFGVGNFSALAAVLAVFGALIPTLAFLLARQVSRWAIVPPAVGLALVFYYPLISLGGYALSEAPFCASLLGMAVLVLRLMDDPRPWVAYALGIVVSFGFVLRPQVLSAVALLGVLWLIYGKRLRIGPMLLVRAAVPFVLVGVLSSGRLYHHTGRFGLISENGSFNRVFGRCHNKKITAHPDRPGRQLTAFSPPSFLQIAKRVRTHPDSWIQLEPATGMKIVYRGYIGDSDIHAGFIQECVRKTGFAGQVKYALTDMALLFKYNVLWPDSGRHMWRRQAKRWGKWHTWFVLWPGLLGLTAPWGGKRFVRHGVVALPVWSILAVAAIYMGSVRLRVPYDPFLMILAAEVYGGGMWGLVWRAVRRNTREDRAVQGSDARRAPPPTD